MFYERVIYTQDVPRGLVYPYSVDKHSFFKTTCRTGEGGFFEFYEILSKRYRILRNGMKKKKIERNWKKKNQKPDRTRDLRATPRGPSRVLVPRRRSLTFGRADELQPRAHDRVRRRSRHLGGQPVEMPPVPFVVTPQHDDEGDDRVHDQLGTGKSEPVHGPDGCLHLGTFSKVEKTVSRKHRTKYIYIYNVLIIYEYR